MMMKIRKINETRETLGDDMGEINTKFTREVNEIFPELEFYTDTKNRIEIWRNGYLLKRFYQNNYVMTVAGFQDFLQGIIFADFVKKTTK